MQDFFNKFTLDELDHIVSIAGTVLTMFLIPIFASIRKLLKNNNRTAEEEIRRKRVMSTLPPLEASINDAMDELKIINHAEVLGEHPENKLVIYNKGFDEEKIEDLTVNDHVRRFLQAMERVGLAMTFDPRIYDLETFAERMGYSTIDRWYRFSKEITRRRKRDQDDGRKSKRYEDFEKLKDNLEEYYKEKGMPYTSRFKILAEQLNKS